MVALSKVSEFIRGVTFKPADKVNVGTMNSIVCMRTKNIQKELDTTDLIAIPKGIVKNDKKLLQRGDILISSANSWELVGKCVYIDTLQYPSTAGGFIAILRAKEQLDSKYLYYWLSSDVIQHKIRWMGKQTTNISNLDTKRFLSLELLLKPIHQQKRIAMILDKANIICKKRQQVIDELDNLLEATFVDMFGDPISNPMGWKSSRLDECSEISSGVTKGRDFANKETILVPYMRVANVQDGYIDLSDVKEMKVLPSEVNKYLLQQGDILLTEGGDPDKLGRGGVWNNQISPCIHQNHIFKVRVNKNILEPEYLCLQIGSQRGKRFFLKAAKQTTGIATINKTQLRSYPVLIPPLELQKKFCQVHKKIMDQKLQYVLLIQESENLFNSLVQRTFNGEL